MAYMYNSWVIPLRSTFPYQTPQNIQNWMIFDYVADVVYLLDLLFIKPRVMYLSDGFWIRDNKLTRVMYFHKFQFKVSFKKNSSLTPKRINFFFNFQMDVVALTPLDLLCLKYGTQHLPLFRLPRLLKVISLEKIKFMSFSYNFHARFFMDLKKFLFSSERMEICVEKSRQRREIKYFSVNFFFLLACSCWPASFFILISIFKNGSILFLIRVLRKIKTSFQTFFVCRNFP